MENQYELMSLHELLINQLKGFTFELSIHEFKDEKGRQSFNIFNPPMKRGVRFTMEGDQVMIYPTQINFTRQMLRERKKNAPTISTFDID